MLQWITEHRGIYESQGATVRINESPFVIVIITALMKRAHALVSSSEVCYVDSTASVDTDGDSVTFLITKSPAGGLPLGIFITDSQSAESYQTGN